MRTPPAQHLALNWCRYISHAITTSVCIVMWHWIPCHAHKSNVKSRRTSNYHVGIRGLGLAIKPATRGPHSSAHSANKCLRPAATWLRSAATQCSHVKRFVARHLMAVASLTTCVLEGVQSRMSTPSAHIHAQRRSYADTHASNFAGRHTLLCAMSHAPERALMGSNVPRSAMSCAYPVESPAVGAAGITVAHCPAQRCASASGAMSLATSICPADISARECAESRVQRACSATRGMRNAR